ncbi:MAG: pyrroline-5-carboxylate reductase [Candidatus Glassbacteria bacterium]|nr:pyrroline-5-carboxylate reductase [Candidatus Glassbacteria bacterium]
MAEIGSIGFIGAGKMGSALISGVLRAGMVKPAEVFFAETDEGALRRCRKKHGIEAVSTGSLAERCRVVVLCVKPPVVLPVIRQLAGALGPGKLVVSVAAGITTGAIEAELAPGVAVVRAMPNIAATVAASATAVAAGATAGREDLELAARLLSSVGLVVELPEALLDAATGLAGSGPAYVFLFTEALISGALKVGLPYHEARALAVQTLKGAAAMLEADPESHPAILRDAVTTPGGTTIAALHELEQKGFRDAVISAVEAAAERSRELGGAGKK